MDLSGQGRKVVLGLGNTLNRDEGLGVHAMKALQQHLQSAGGNLTRQVEFLDGGVLGLNLLPWVEESSHLLVLDAIDASRPPGTVIELKGSEIPLYNGIKVSDHQVTFQEVLGLASFRGHMPPFLHLIGLQPADISTGIDLSPAALAALPEVVNRAAAVLDRWQLVTRSEA
jgi:hydrogenase maturation protease